ncbi:MAG: transposase, partial [Duncaniella sp.]|nr:transposase [Duncaniella sp.]
SRYNCTYHIVFIPKYRRKVVFRDLRQNAQLLKRAGMDISAPAR